MLLIFIHCVRTGCRTFYQKEVKIDEALVTTPSQPSFPFTHRQELKKGINQVLDSGIEATVILKDISKL